MLAGSLAVALLPPLASLGLLLGSGYLFPALGAGLLLITNIICVNLAGVVVFWIQGGAPHQLVGGEAGPKGDEDFHRRLRRLADPSGVGYHPVKAD